VLGTGRLQGQLAASRAQHRLLRRDRSLLHVVLCCREELLRTDAATSNLLPWRIQSSLICFCSACREYISAARMQGCCRPLCGARMHAQGRQAGRLQALHAEGNGRAQPVPAQACQAFRFAAVLPL
jgi:hypothetical protein